MVQLYEAVKRDKLILLEENPSPRLSTLPALPHLVVGREETVRDLKPDLVLLDLMMPDMDGWEVYQQMKTDDELKAIPVIVVTAKAQSIDKVLGLHIAKVDDYVTKPFGPQELLQSVNKVLDL